MIIILISLLGLILRLILSGQSLWLDEAASVVIASQPVGTLIKSLVSDFHPPLYYLLLKPWLSIAGQTEWLLRLPGIIIGTLTIPALYCLVNQVFGKDFSSDGSAAWVAEAKRRTPPRWNPSIAHLAALLLALNPLHIYYSQELRMYALSALLAVLTWQFLLKKKFFIYTLLTIISFYTYYLSIFILISQWLYIIFHKRKQLKPFVISNLVFAISLLPWLPTLLKQLQGGGYLKTALPGWSALSGNLSLKSLVLIPAKFSLGRISILPKNLYYLVIALVLSFISLLFVLTLRVKRSKLFLFWLFTPFILAILISLVTPILGYWRYIFLLPAFTTLLAIGISYLPKKTFVLNLSFIILLFLFSNLFFIINPKFHREDWSSLAKLINAQDDDTLLIVNFTDAFAPLKFYLPQAKVFPTQVKLGQVRPDIDEELTPLINRETSVYYLDYLSDLTSPDRPILTWLDMAGLKKKMEYQFIGLGAVYEYQAP